MTVGHWPMLVVLVACKSGGPGAEDSAEPSTTDTSAPADTPSNSSGTAPTSSTTSTTSTTRTGTTTGSTSTSTSSTGAGYRDGTYTGDMVIDMADGGFVVNYDTCTVPLTLTVLEGQAPQITGAATCPFLGILAPTSAGLDFTGDITSDPYLAGTIRLSYNWVNTTDVFDGSFVGPDTLTGTFSGSRTMGSATVDWSGRFTLLR